MILVKRDELRSQKGTIITGSMGNELYEDSDLDRQEGNAAAGMVVGCGAMIAFLLLLTLFFIFYPSDSEAQKLDPVSLNVEVIPADTCSLVYDMRGFRGKTVEDYIDLLEALAADDGLFFLRPGDLLVMYHIESKGRKACLYDILNQAVIGTDLTWECDGANILIYRK